MSTPFIAEIKIISWNFPPKGWAFCNGQLMPINQNQALFSLLGTTYGGDGRVNFALPDLRGRIPTGRGNGHTLGERGGEEAHTLSQGEMPQHVHLAQATATQAAFDSPTNNVLGGVNINAYVAPTAFAAMNAGVIAPAGGSQPHLNMSPYLTLNFVIALQGIFPSPN